MVENQIHTPEGWVKLESIGNLGKIFNGLSGKTKADFGEGEPYIPYVNVFKNSCIDVNEFDLVRVKKGEHQNKVLYGDLIFTTSSETIEEVGMTSVYLDKANSFYLNSFCFCFRLNDFNTILPEFARYLFRSNTVRYSITLLGQGSTRYNLSKTRLLTELKILIPKSTIEQQSIADILSKTDQAITNTVALIAKYTRIKTGLMQDLLTKGIDENGNIRSEQTHEFKDSPLGRIPKEWECEKLSKISSISRGKFTPRPRNNPIYYNGDFPFIQTGDISNCKELYLNNFTQTLNEKGILVSKKFPAGTIVMTIAANIGDTAILGKEMYLTDSVVGIIPSIDEIYFELFLRSIKKQLENLATQSAQKNINIQKLNEVLIKFPIDDNEQKRISKKYISIINSIKSFETELTKLQSLKTGLMQDLLTGKVRVKKLI